MQPVTTQARVVPAASDSTRPRSASCKPGPVELTSNTAGFTPPAGYGIHLRGPWLRLPQERVWQGPSTKATRSWCVVVTPTCDRGENCTNVCANTLQRLLVARSSSAAAAVYGTLQPRAGVFVYSRSPYAPLMGGSVRPKGCCKGCRLDAVLQAVARLHGRQVCAAICCAVQETHAAVHRAHDKGLSNLPALSASKHAATAASVAPSVWKDAHSCSWSAAHGAAQVVCHWQTPTWQYCTECPTMRAHAPLAPNANQRLGWWWTPARSAQSTFIHSDSQPPNLACAQGDAHPEQAKDHRGRAQSVKAQARRSVYTSVTVQHKHCTCTAELVKGQTCTTTPGCCRWQPQLTPRDLVQACCTILSSTGSTLHPATACFAGLLWHT